MTTCTVGGYCKHWRGTGWEKKLLCFLVEFWERQEVVTYQNGLHGPQFLVTRGTTQEVLDSHTLFNVALDRVVRHCLALTLEDESVIHDGLEMVAGRSIGVVYAYDDLIGSRDLE